MSDDRGAITDDTLRADTTKFPPNIRAPRQLVWYAPGMVRLLKDDPIPPTNVYNGDPRKWPLGLYRSRSDHNRVVIVVENEIGSKEQTAIVVGSSYAHAQISNLGDGYIRLPKGEMITIEA